MPESNERTPNEQTLVIVESPAKAKTIGRFLGPEYRVEASYGHVRDLPQNAKEIPAKIRGESWARLGVDIAGSFEPVYVVPADKKKYVQRLKKAAKDSNRLLLATDEDREGESISWHVLELLRPKKDVDVQRIVFHEVTPEAIKKALASPREVNTSLVRAQEARRVLDRLYGYTLSPLLWKRVAPGLSAGRVQSVAVRLLVQRERERTAFHRAEYWDLRATLEAEGGRFRARLVRLDDHRLAEGSSFDPETGELADAKRLHLESQAAQTLAESVIKIRPWTLTRLDRKPGSQRPAPPFITSTLQQEGNRKHRFTARRTMRIAQQLYEGIDLKGERVGLITYMRTDSVNLAERAIAQAREVITQAYGADYLPAEPVRYKTKAKRAQEAHEAIRPTDLSRRPQDVRPFLDAEQLKLYELIWKRTLASQMKAARFERTAVEVSVETEQGTAVFAARGKRIVFPGFLRAYVEGSDDPSAELGDQEKLLPALTLDQALAPAEVTAESHETRPPARFTEASLVKKLEEEGIGRPSTYAAIISTIQDRGYVFKKGGELVPTFTAFCVTELLEQQFCDLVEVRFTALMEDELDQVAAGKQAWDELVARFFRGNGQKPGLEQRVSQGEVTYPAIQLGVDPQSGQALTVKIGRYGPYLRQGEGEKSSIVSLPEDLPPADLTTQRALELLRAKNGDKEPITTTEPGGRNVYLQHGRFGAYLEVEQSEDEKAAKTKPHRVSLPRDVKEEELTPAMAQRLVSLPRTLGPHPESGEDVLAGLGRYGPFIKHGSDYRNLPGWQQACDIQLAEALEMLKAPKVSRRRGATPRTVLKALGEHEQAAGPIQVLDGRYGPYVTDGKTNASLPKGSDPMSIGLEQALELLEARRKNPPRRRVTRRRRS